MVVMGRSPGVVAEHLLLMAEKHLEKPLIGYGARIRNIGQGVNGHRNDDKSQAAEKGLAESLPPDTFIALYHIPDEPVKIQNCQSKGRVTA